jgi:selenophosphate synthetase-related protein
LPTVTSDMRLFRSETNPQILRNYGAGDKRDEYLTLTEPTLRKVAERFRTSPEVRGKSSLRMLSEIFGSTDWLSGPGDDAAVVESGDGYILVGGEAIWPPLVEEDPFAAGVASVVANVNDVAAMGGRCLALIDHVVARQEVARKVLEGIHFAAGLYRVVVAGGHLTIWDGAASVSASIVGRALRPLSATNVAPGQALLLACCLTGTMRPDFPFFSSVRDRGASLAEDVEILPSLAEAGLGMAAKDVSMAGILGSLAMLLEPTRCGAEVDLATIPRPDDVPLDRWMFTFPTFAFLITAPADESADLCARFRDRDLSCEHIGNIDPTGRLMVRLGHESSQLLDLNTEAVTGLIRRVHPPEA